MRAFIKKNDGTFYEFKGNLSLRDTQYMSGGKLLEVTGGKGSTMAASKSEKVEDFYHKQFVFSATEIDYVHITY